MGVFGWSNNRQRGVTDNVGVGLSMALAATV